VQLLDRVEPLGRRVVGAAGAGARVLAGRSRRTGLEACGQSSARWGSESSQRRHVGDFIDPVHWRGQRNESIEKDRTIMLPSLTATAAARFRARRTDRAERNRLRAELASYRTPAERADLEAILARHAGGDRRPAPAFANPTRTPPAAAPLATRLARSSPVVLGPARRCGRCGSAGGVAGCERGFRLRHSCEVGR
jgi:hypothetical protein